MPRRWSAPGRLFWWEAPTCREQVNPDCILPASLKSVAVFSRLLPQLRGKSLPNVYAAKYNKTLSSGIAPMTGYERLKKYREKKSLERERKYLARDWRPECRYWNARQCAARKRWVIYYTRRARARAAGEPLSPRIPSHWVTAEELQRKLAREKNIHPGPPSREVDSRRSRSPIEGWNPAVVLNRSWR
jgi:hypothetical protein